MLDVADRGAGYGIQGISTSIDVAANALPIVEGWVFGVDKDATFTGQVLRPVTYLTGKFDDWIRATNANTQARIENDTRDSKVAQVAADIGSGVVGALPSAVMAILSGGSSAVAQLGTQATGISGTVVNAANTMLHNPVVQYNFAASLGNEFNAAKASGASDMDAMTAATVSGLFNAIVESGGVEALPKQLQGTDLSTAQKAWSWLIASFSEGGEEVVQGVISEMTAKAAYASDKPYFSITDENAVINPGRMGREFGYGTAIGGTVGAVPMASAKAMELWARAQRENGGRAQIQNVSEVQQNKTAPGGETGTSSKASVGEKVSVGMSDDQRYNLLKDRAVPLYSYNEAKMAQTEESDGVLLRKASKSQAFSILRKIGEQFGVFKDYHNTDIDIDFGFSKRKMSESVNKQNGEYQNYAKMLSIFDELLESAVGIETHSNRYENKGEQVKQTYVLASAFEGVNGIVPVLFEVREFKDGTKSMLHVAVNMSEIERGRIVVHNSTNEIADAPYTLPASSISIADLFKNINTTDGRFLKYVPNEFLSPEQIRSKQIALVEQEEYVRRKNERNADAEEKQTIKENEVGVYADSVRVVGDEEYLAFIRHLEAAELWQKVEELKQEYRRNMERLEEAEREAELDAAFWKGFDR